MQKEGRVAVIDIGSNTIKLLVAERAEGGRVETLHRNTLETRIGQGIGAAKPSFTSAVIALASDAVARLVEEARSFEPVATRIVATSAARDASNGADLGTAVFAKTGFPLEILGGRREAELIGAAIRLDPRVTAPDFYVFDLGGGSLECLRFSNRRLEQVVSLPLGCVRLTEKLLTDPGLPFTAEDRKTVETEVEQILETAGFTFSLGTRALAIGTGGTLTTALNILAAREGRDLPEMPPYLSLDALRELLTSIGELPMEERLRIPRLSRGRADVFPTALSTFIRLAELCQQTGLHHSLMNLRYGLAAELLHGATVRKT